MTILVTGASGWLGRFLVPLLRSLGDSVVGLDVVPGVHTDVVASIADRPALEALFAAQPIDAVVHAAALHKPDIARYPRQAFVDVNVSGTLSLLELAVAHGVSRFVFTSTTSLMISTAIREARGETAVWLDEDFAPIEPRNIYGVTKLAAERVCRLIHDETGLPVIVLRTSRFFPEEDDTHRALSGENMKANELLHRRLTVEDAAEAHVVALARAPAIGFGTYIVSAPTPFERSDVAEIKRDALAVIGRLFPDAEALYARRGWTLPASIDRVYDAGRAGRELGWRARTDFAALLGAMREDGFFPLAHDPNYVSPQEIARQA